MNETSQRKAARRIVRISEVLARSGLSRSSVWRLERQGSFPAHFKIGLRAVGWYADEFDNWLNNRRSGGLAATPTAELSACSSNTMPRTERTPRMAVSAPARVLPTGSGR
jgi:predicted DNA-binding transcriptional regulator AlpA